MFIQQLESRVLLASSMSITGTSGKDVISIKQTNSSTSSASISVSNGGSSGSVSVKVGSTTSTINHGSSKSFTSIKNFTLIDLGAGDDKLTLDSSVKIPASISGGDGKDTITGGSGADVISGDKATSGTYNDSIHGGAGNDTIYGYGGNDVLYGDDGNDSIRGGNGNDSIEGDKGNDKMFGEAGDDFFNIVDGYVDTLDGGSGTDSSQPTQADHDVATTMEDVAAAAGVDNPNGPAFTITGTPSNNNITASVDSSGVLTVKIDGITVKYTHADRLAAIKSMSTKGSDADRIFIFGGAGNDTIAAGAGIEYINGGTGNDTLSSTTSSNPPNGKTFTMVGGPGNDKLTANNSQVADIDGDQDTFTELPSVSGSDGNDTIVGSKYDDNIDAGSGDDNVRPGTAMESSLGDGEQVTFHGFTSGRDTLDLHDRSDDLTIVFDSNTEISVMGSKGDSDIEDNDDTTPVIIGGSGDDHIQGSDSSKGDSLDGGGGNDTIFGLDGNDTLIGSSGNDSLDGGAGNDLFHNKDGQKDTVIGGDGTDTADKASGDNDVISQVETLV